MFYYMCNYTTDSCTCQEQNEKNMRFFEIYLLPDKKKRPSRGGTVLNDGMFPDQLRQPDAVEKTDPRSLSF